MLIVTGVIGVKASGLKDAKQAILAMVRETVKEQGCHVYEFSEIVGVENSFRVYEEWQDEAALEAHTKTPHMADFRAALGEAGIVSRKLNKFEGGEKTSLG